jgi:hypothetical protein
MQKRPKKDNVKHTHTKAHTNLLNCKIRKQSSIPFKQLTFELKCPQHFAFKNT